MAVTISQLLLLPINFIDKILLFVLVTGYEKLMYKPLQAHLIPLVARLPREVSIAGHRVTVLTANGVTWSRTSLLIVIAFGLKFDYCVLAAVCVVANDLLDHLDGIVAIAQRQVYGNIDSPLFGAFIDAFCDKVVNVSVMWSILLLVDMSVLSLWQLLVLVCVACAVIVFECAIGIIRVQDYYRALYGRKVGRERDPVRAGMEGKTKEKLENIGLCLLCLAMAHPNPLDTWSGVVGVVSLGLSVRFAIGSMLRKLEARQHQESAQAEEVFEAGSNSSNQKHLNGWLPRQQSAPAFTTRSSTSESEDDSVDTGERVDKIYTVGCFDLFHRGHRKLLRNMRGLGREVIVGIHNDDSYHKLKNKHPIDTVERRMNHVKEYADQVFVISNTDPSPYLTCCIHLKPRETALYVRGDDMPHFPGRSVVEPLMPVKLLPYTQGVSSTQLRAEYLKQLETDKHVE